LSPRRSARVGVGLVPRGEFSLIIGTIALAGSGLTLPAATAETLYAFAVGYVLLMSVVGTTLMGSSGPFERFATRRLGGSPPAERG
jgi:CPA2 family monovalent cation:H+ antiporter-2